ncbi:F-box/kelch-repeat protein SKIP20-like [Typha latifolia]|uniref:F-box/kelch-repeat protein SKIP20-like n=1 Tax=Typha latifolia TaxID=4733 RepID=UPI003C2E3BFD
MQKREKLAEMGEEKVLIPGLPDDVAIDCLARVPHRFHSCLRHVSRGWRDLVTARDFFQHRDRIGAAEDLIFLVQAKDEGDGGGRVASGEGGKAAESLPPVYGVTLYNATDGEWRRSPAPVPLFAQCAAAGGKLVVAGGWDPATLEPVAEVRIHDLFSGIWRRGAPMSSPRSFFAIAAAGSTLFVAGGHDGAKNALRTAEAYDVAGDEWTPLPDMAEERDECQGAVVGTGGFMAVSGYATERQGQFGETAEWYDESGGEWRKVEGVWESGGGVVCGDGVRVWRVEKGGVSEYDVLGKGWRKVAAAPTECMTATAAAAARGVGGEVRVLVVGKEGEEGGNGVWVMEAGSGKWRRVEMPPGFRGFVFSAAAIRL